MRALVLCLAFFPSIAMADALPSATSLKDIDQSALATCGAGFDQSTSASLGALLRKVGGVSADFRQQAKAAILDDDTLPEKDRLAAYQLFLSCLDRRAPK